MADEIHQTDDILPCNAMQTDCGQGWVGVVVGFNTLMNIDADYECCSIKLHVLLP